MIKTIESISITSPGVIRHPLHQHSFCEVMYYTEGVGFLKTEYGNYPFSPGTAIIVPPNVLHGSVSQNGFENISISGSFNSILIGNKPIAVISSVDAAALCKLVYKNRFKNPEYLNTLANCYILSLMQAYNTISPIDAAVEKIVIAISENTCNPNFNIAKELNLSGYAEDYIRAKFKEICGETPTEFLNRLRIKKACRMIEIFGDSISITELSNKVGFSNPAYFSRVFKKYSNVNPKKYYSNKNNNP